MKSWEASDAMWKQMPSKIDGWNVVENIYLFRSTSLLENAWYLLNFRVGVDVRAGSVDSSQRFWVHDYVNVNSTRDERQPNQSQYNQRRIHSRALCVWLLLASERNGRALHSQTRQTHANFRKFRMMQNRVKVRPHYAHFYLVPNDPISSLSVSYRGKIFSIGWEKGKPLPQALSCELRGLHWKLFAPFR